MNHPARARVGLVALTVAFAVAYMFVGLFRHWHFSSNADDLGIFDQAVWLLSRFEVPASGRAQGYRPVFQEGNWIVPARQ